jgi:hypothetical protein
VFERANTFHASGRAVTVIGKSVYVGYKNITELVSVGERQDCMQAISFITDVNKLLSSQETEQIDNQRNMEKILDHKANKEVSYTDSDIESKHVIKIRNKRNHPSDVRSLL